MDLVYAPANVAEVVDIMSTLATKESLAVHGSGHSTPADASVSGDSFVSTVSGSKVRANLAGFDDVETMRAFLKNNEGFVGGAIVFHTNNTDNNCVVPTGKLPCKVKYEVWYNQTYGGGFVNDWGGDIMVSVLRSRRRRRRAEARPELDSWPLINCRREALLNLTYSTLLPHFNRDSSPSTGRARSLSGRRGPSTRRSSARASPKRAPLRPLAPRLSPSHSSPSPISPSLEPSTVHSLEAPPLWKHTGVSSSSLRSWQSLSSRS